MAIFFSNRIAWPSACCVRPTLESEPGFYKGPWPRSPLLFQVQCPPDPSLPPCRPQLSLGNEYAAAAPAHARREHKAGETAANDHNIRPVNLATASRTQEIAHH